MDKKTNIGENFCTHKPQCGVEDIPFLYGQHSPADRLESCSNLLWIGKDL